MRFSRLFGRTLREAPAEADIISHQLLVRAGYITQLGAGIFSYMHLAQRSFSKIKKILREEMNAIGGQEITMPVVQPADIWKETGRWYQIGSEMGRFKDKNDRDMVLAMTHEEVVTDLVRHMIHSYKDLPRMIYHIQTKWRDDPRPRAGLIRVREFTMKDSYTLDTDWDGLDHQYQSHYDAYHRIFQRCGLPVVAVRSDVGMMGGKMAHEFMYLTPIGEDTLVICDHCGYIANRQVATFKKSIPQTETPMPVELVATPDTKTIEDLAAFLNIPKSKTAKAVFLVALINEDNLVKERFIFAVIRGDMEVNETKLANALKSKDLRPATEAEIKAVGAVPGYASPIGLKDVLVIIDDHIQLCPNLVAGANRDGYHLLNVNYGRDFSAEIIADIATAEDKAPCPDCGYPMRISRGVEVANIFKLGTRYTDVMGATFVDRDGKIKPVVMGSYGIGLGRLLACVAEEHHDENGLIWPISISPFQVHMVSLRGVEIQAEELYTHLGEAGIEVFWDDREESPGVKFNDADLIGIPIRITIGERSIKSGGVELKLRNSSERSNIALNNILNCIREKIAFLEAA